MFKPRLISAAHLPVCLLMMMVCGGAMAQAKPAAPAPAVHSHGGARLTIAVDANMLTLEFESPLENLVGFENTPRNEKQKAAVQRMSEVLQKADRLFIPSAAAQCVLQSARFDSPVLAAEKGATAKSGGAAHAGQGAADGHADINGTIVFRCERSGQLRDLEVALFDSFPGVKRLDVQIAGVRGQKSLRLSAAARRAVW
jgi:hypothetical protein